MIVIKNRNGNMIKIIVNGKSEKDDKNLLRTEGDTPEVGSSRKMISGS